MLLIHCKCGKFHSHFFGNLQIEMRWKYLTIYFNIFIVLFAAKHSWMTVSMSRPLFVGSYVQVTWWALGQWKGRQICIIAMKCSLPHCHKMLTALFNNSQTLKFESKLTYILHFLQLSIIIMVTSNEHNSRNSGKRDWWINSQVYHCY